ncbi:MAG: hypothetical protein ACPG75_04980 [Alloalcanivorax venustensis]
MDELLTFSDLEDPRERHERLEAEDEVERPGLPRPKQGDRDGGCNCPDHCRFHYSDGSDKWLK